MFIAFETFVQEIKSKIISIIFFFRLGLGFFPSHLFFLFLCLISLEIEKKRFQRDILFLYIHLLYFFLFLSILSFIGFTDKKQINHLSNGKVFHKRNRFGIQGKFYSVLNHFWSEFFNHCKYKLNAKHRFNQFNSYHHFSIQYKYQRY